MNSNRFGQCAFMLIGLLRISGAHSPLSAEESATPSSVTDETNSSKEARSQVDKLLGSSIVNGVSRPLQFSEKPVLSFSDPTRRVNKGSIWLIGTDGRPRAILSLFLNDAERFRSYEFSSLSLEPVSVERPDKWKWETKEKGLNFREFKDQSVPADSNVTRMTQMKAIAREFSAAEVHLGSRSELRLLTQPLHRYSEEKEGIIDGTMFAFAHGTDPEILLVIESSKKTNGTMTWRYGVVRLSAAELHLSFKETEVWTVDAVRHFVGGEPYFSVQELAGDEGKPVKKPRRSK